MASSTGTEQPVLGDIAMVVALSMAAFAVLFGTRHTPARCACASATRRATLTSSIT